MDKNVENAIDNFNTDDDDLKNQDSKVRVIKEDRQGLIERIDRTLVTNDGRQLLREQY